MTSCDIHATFLVFHLHFGECQFPTEPPSLSLVARSILDIPLNLVLFRTRANISELCHHINN